MFALLSLTELILLALLLIGWLGAYLIGMMIGASNEDHSRRLPRWAKLAMIGFTLVAGVFWWQIAAGTNAVTYALLVMLGLLAGAVGDLILADMLNIEKAELAAMGIFGVGHVFYIAAALTIRGQLGMQSIEPILLAVLIGTVIVAVLWAVIIRNPDGSRTLNVASLLYGILLGDTVAIASVVAFQGGVLAVFPIGLGVFLVSDVLLAQYLIRKQDLFPYMRDVVWIVYSSAQLMISFSIGAAVVVL